MPGSLRWKCAGVADELDVAVHEQDVAAAGMWLNAAPPAVEADDAGTRRCPHHGRRDCASDPVAGLLMS